LNSITTPHSGPGAKGDLSISFQIYERPKYFCRERITAWKEQMAFNNQQRPRERDLGTAIR
jgi:hypothetical protein